jgi:cytochrome c oxidase subunit 2
LNRPSAPAGRGLALVLGGALLAGGCGNEDQSTLDPVSRPARLITELWWWMLGGAGVVFAGAVVLLLLAWLRRNRRGMPIFGQREPFATGLVVTFGIVIPAIALIALFAIGNIFVLRVTDAPARGTTALTVEVVGHQWWWEVRYPESGAVTANEIHIPVRTRVDLIGRSADVIHSFWAPNLNRKIDVIPGRVNRILLYSDRVGRFRGQCAEFCGIQHAHMGLWVVVQPRQEFDAWLARMAAPAEAPQGAGAVRGEQVFLSQPCAGCHTIRGTDAAGTLGPDLTHLALRQSLAALTIPNDRASLAQWIVDPQHAKPGNKMPGLALPNPDLEALLAYLEGLK